jgi:hypothetical protein
MTSAQHTKIRKRLIRLKSHLKTNLIRNAHGRGEKYGVTAQ